MPTKTLARKAAIGGAALLTALGLVTAVGTAQASASAQHSTNESNANHESNDGAPQHIFYIMMENHGTSQVIGNTADAPYITSLAQRYNVATNFHGVTHPSLPNYLTAISGDFQGIWDDCKAGANVTCAPEEFVPGSGDATSGASLTQAQYASASAKPHMFKGKNIVDQLEAKDLSWKAYMQSMPSVGFQGEYAPVVNGTTVKLYAQKHNPFMYFSDINSPNNPRLNKIVPFEQNFDADLASGHVPNFVWVSPDQCHDMHGVSPSNAALGGGDAPLIVITSTGGPHKTSNKLADHYTVLATIEHMWHLGCLANTCSPRTSGLLENLVSD